MEENSHSKTYETASTSILDSEVNEEIKDILMGHVRPSAKGNYSFGTASIVRIYREQIFPKLAINGWALKEKASEVDTLKKEVSELKNALTHVESENASYKTRVDNLQEQISNLAENSQRNEELVKQIQERLSGYSKLKDNYDLVVKAIADISDDYLVFVDPESEGTLKLAIKKKG